jgi:glycosyltransferase involved in cell wall biosynthesis
VPYLATLGVLPRALRPRLALTVIDCTLPESFRAPPPLGTYERQVLDAHRFYFRWTRLDGIYSWYRAFVAAANGIRIAGHPLARAARFCFTEPDRFSPQPIKERIILFAGRLSEQKRPIMFVDAVARLRQREPELLRGWRVSLYGRGVLEPAVRERIAQLGLSDIATLTHSIDMAPAFARSRLLVSTQAIENFTSLSMLEAMSAGNAVIAEDVGQTREFVRHQQNGLLVASASADAFADAIAEYLRHPERHDAMAKASRSIATDEHTLEHFAEDITTFWSDVLRRERG